MIYYHFDGSEQHIVKHGDDKHVRIPWCGDNIAPIFFYSDQGYRVQTCAKHLLSGREITDISDIPGLGPDGGWFDVDDTVRLSMRLGSFLRAGTPDEAANVVGRHPMFKHLLAVGFTGVDALLGGLIGAMGDPRLFVDDPARPWRAGKLASYFSLTRQPSSNDEKMRYWLLPTLFSECVETYFTEYLHECVRKSAQCQDPPDDPEDAFGILLDIMLNTCSGCMRKTCRHLLVFMHRVWLSILYPDRGFFEPERFFSSKEWCAKYHETLARLS